MKNRQNLNCGYIGLIALLIAVLIMVFLMLQEYQSFGLGQLKNATTTNDNGSGVTSDTMTPIEQAQNVKKIIETHNKDLLNQMK